MQFMSPADQPTNLEPHKLQRVYHLHVWDESTSTYLPHNEIKMLTIHDDKLYVDGHPHPILEPQRNCNRLHWNQASGEAYTVGNLHFTPDGLCFVGTIVHGSTPETLEEFAVAGLAPPTSYQTTITDGVTEQPGVPIRLGYEIVEGSPSSWIEIGTEGNCLSSKPDSDGNIALSVAFTLADNGELKIHILPVNKDVVTKLVEQIPLFPAEATIQFSWDGQSFNGTMQKYNTDGTVDSTQLTWTGQSKTQHQILALQSLSIPRTSFLRRAITTEAFSLPTENLISAPPQAMLLAIENPSQLTVANLLGNMPNSNDVQTTSFNMLTENMKWALGDRHPDWLTDFFEEEQPTLDQNRINLIQQNEDFYANKLGASQMCKNIN